MVGTGTGAEHGILIKNAESLERAADIRTVVLDKTGTITEGKPVVTDVVVTKDQRLQTKGDLAVADIADEGGRAALVLGRRSLVSSNELLWLAASAEKGSEHPLGAAIVQAAQDRAQPPIIRCAWWQSHRAPEPSPGASCRCLTSSNDVPIGRPASTAQRVLPEYRTMAQAIISQAVRKDRLGGAVSPAGPALRTALPERGGGYGTKEIHDP
jgi:cation transport ATPase